MHTFTLTLSRDATSRETRRQLARAFRSQTFVWRPVKQGDTFSLVVEAPTADYPTVEVAMNAARYGCGLAEIAVLDAPQAPGAAAEYDGAPQTRV